MTVGITAAAKTGTMTPRDLGCLIVGVVAGLCCQRAPWFSRVLLALTWAGTIIAFFGPEVRGSHRWITLGDTVNVNLVLPILVLTIITAAGTPRIQNRALLWTVSEICLVFMQAYLAASLLGLAILPLLRLRPARVLTLGAAALLILLTLVWSSDNRRMRLNEFLEGKSYHTKQVKRTLARLTWMPPDEVDLVHLPASRTDLAPLHVARTLGLLAALLYACSLAAVAFTAYADGERGRSVCLLLFACLLLQLGMSAGRLPIMGLASPFLSAGATQWVSFSLLLAWLSVPPPRPDEPCH